MLGVNIQCFSFSKRKFRRSENVSLSIGKFKRKRKNALIKSIAYNFWNVSNGMVCTISFCNQNFRVFRVNGKRPKGIYCTCILPHRLWLPSCFRQEKEISLGENIMTALCKWKKLHCTATWNQGSVYWKTRPAHLKCVHQRKFIITILKHYWSLARRHLAHEYFCLRHVFGRLENEVFNKLTLIQNFNIICNKLLSKHLISLTSGKPSGNKNQKWRTSIRYSHHLIPIVNIYGLLVSDGPDCKKISKQNLLIFYKF